MLAKAKGIKGYTKMNIDELKEAKSVYSFMDIYENSFSETTRY